MSDFGDRTASSVALPAEIDDFLLWLTVEKGRSEATIAAYRRDMRSWAAQLERTGHTVHSVDEETVIAHLRAQQASGKAPASVARAMVAVRALHGFLLAEDVRIDDPTAHVEMPTVPRGLPKALSVADVGRLVESIPTDRPADRRDRAMVEVLYGTGVRISELVGTSLGDLDMADALMRVFGKGAKERVVPLGSYARDSLGDWLDPAAGRGAMEPKRWASRDASEALWLNARGGRLTRQGAWGVVKRRAAAVGLGAKMSPHVLRHSCATHMLDHGADIRTVQELLGHASVSTTQVYTLVSQRRLREVFEAAHPRAGRG